MSDEYVKIIWLDENVKQKIENETLEVQEVWAEFGTSSNIGFANMKAFDIDGNELIMKCKCGSTEGVSRIMGKESYVDRCHNSIIGE